MSLERKISTAFGLSFASIAAVIFWGGMVQTKLDKQEHVNRIVEQVNQRLANIEGALHIKNVASSIKESDN